MDDSVIIIAETKEAFDYLVWAYGQIYIKGKWHDLSDLSPKIKYSVDTESGLLTTESGVEYFFRMTKKVLQNGYFRSF